MRLRDDTDHERMWLKSYWGFNPQSWGCIGFTEEYRRDRFVREFFRPDLPSALVAIYITKTAPRENRHMASRIVGVMELSFTLGFAEHFIDLEQEPFVRKDVEAGRWRYSIKAKRAWRIIESAWPLVHELADQSYWPSRARYIGAQGVEMADSEAGRILDLPVTRAELFMGR